MSNISESNYTGFLFNLYGLNWNRCICIADNSYMTSQYSTFNKIVQTNSFMTARLNILSHPSAEHVSNMALAGVGWLCWGLTSQSTIFQSYRDGLAGVYGHMKILLSHFLKQYSVCYFWLCCESLFLVSYSSSFFLLHIGPKVWDSRICKLADTH